MNVDFEITNEFLHKDSYLIIVVVLLITFVTFDYSQGEIQVQKAQNMLCP
jgi:hypothetical protein